MPSIQYGELKYSEGYRELKKNDNCRKRETGWRGVRGKGKGARMESQR